MNRYIYIFFATALFVCYSGLCGDAFALGNPDTPGMEMAGCHEMGHKGDKAESGKTDQKLNNEVNESMASCCHDGLINTDVVQLPQLGRIVVAEIDFTSSNDNFNNSLFREDSSPREHDPPDLQIVNSTFLL